MYVVVGVGGFEDARARGCGGLQGYFAFLQYGQHVQQIAAVDELTLNVKSSSPLHKHRVVCLLMIDHRHDGE